MGLLRRVIHACFVLFCFVFRKNQFSSVAIQRALSRKEDLTEESGGVPLPSSVCFNPGLAISRTTRAEKDVKHYLFG